MFHFIDPHMQENPGDVLTECASALGFLCSVMTHRERPEDELQLTGDDLSGLNVILRAIERCMRDTVTMIQEQSEKRAEGPRRN